MCVPMKLKRVSTNSEATVTKNSFGFLRSPTKGIYEIVDYTKQLNIKFDRLMIHKIILLMRLSITK